MIKEKYIPKLAYLFIILALLICTSIYLYNKFTPETLVQPDYIQSSFNKDEIMEINIEIDEDNLTSLIENALQEQYVPANITINGTTINNIGIRAKGNSSLRRVSSSTQPERYSFKINFSEYITDQNFLGLEKMVLNNMIGDSTYLKEYLSYDLMEFLNINTPAFCFANININGKYWGLYLAVEALEEDFLERYYGKDYGNLYKPDTEDGGAGGDKNQMQQPPEMMEGEENQIQQPPEMMEDEENQIQQSQKTNRNSQAKVTGLIYIDDEISSYSTIFDSVVTDGLTKQDKYKYIEMVKALNNGEDIEKYLDVDEILRYFAVNTFLVNLDSYAGNMKHNYYLYEENGVFSILPWDFNLSFGTFQMNSGQKVINFPIDEPVTDTMENSPLISKLLEIDEYKNLYYSYLNQIVEEYVNSGIYENKINTLNKLIYDYVAIDDVAFYTLEEYELGIQNLLIYGEDRAKSISLQLSGQQPSDEYGNLETTFNVNALGTLDNSEDSTKSTNKKTSKTTQVQQSNKTKTNINSTKNSIKSAEKNSTQTFSNNQQINSNTKMDNTINKQKSDGTQPRGKQQNISLYKNIFIYGFILLICLIYVLKYKRKKYRT